MNQRTPSNTGAQRGTRPQLTDHAFERLLEAHADGDLSPQARRVLEAELANSSERRGEFERSERLIVAMRQPEPFPDLSESILDRLEDRGVLLPGRKRRFIAMARYAAVVAIGLGIGSLVLFERHAPGSTPIGSGAAAPVGSVVSSVVEAGKNGVGSGAAQVRQAVRTLESEILPRSVAAPEASRIGDIASAQLPSSDRPKALGLKLGNTSRGDTAIKWTLGQGVAKSAVLPARQESALAAILAEPDETGLWLGMEIKAGSLTPRGPVKTGPVLGQSR